MDLQIKLKCNMFYQKGSAVKIQVSVKNLTNKTQYILKRLSPFSEWDSHCFSVKYGEEEVAYDSIYAKMGAVRFDEFMPLLPKQKANVTLNLAQSYLMKKSGKYTVSLQHGLYYTRFPDQFEAYMKYQEMQKKSSFFMVGRGEIYKTFGMRQKEETDILRGSMRFELTNNLPAPVIDQTAIKYKNEIKDSHFALYHYMEAAEKEIRNESLSDQNLHHQMIFGAYDSARYETVKTNISKLKEAVTNKQIMYHYDGTHPDWYAYVCKNNPDTVYLCNLFLSAPFTGMDSQMGTIAHELSHLYADAVDVKLSPGVACYGRTNCRKLAETDPVKAITNAENYEYYIETMYTSFQDEVGSDIADFEETAGEGGPSVLYHPVGNFHELFYLGKDKALHNVIYGAGGFLPGKALMTEEDKPLLAASHPTVIHYQDKTWVFYQTDDTKQLFYSILNKQEKWSIPKKIQYKKVDKGVETIHEITPLSPPNLLIHENKLKLIYTGIDFEMHMIAYQDEVWSMEESIPNSTGLVKELRHNPAPFVYQNDLHIVYANRKVDNKMEVAKYNQATNAWSITNTIPRINSEFTKTQSEISTFCTIDDVMILYSKSNKDIRILHLKYDDNTKKDMWTDAENIVENSPKTYSPTVDSLCAISKDDKYFYLFYWNSTTKKLSVSRKINCF